MHACIRTSQQNAKSVSYYGFAVNNPVPVGARANGIVHPGHPLRKAFALDRAALQVRPQGFAL